MVASYADFGDLADRLGIPLTDDDPRAVALDQAVDAASRWVDRQTGRRFYATAGEVRYYTTIWQYPRWGQYGSSYGDYPWGNPERPGGGGVAGQHITIDDYITVSEVATDTDGDGTYDAVWTVGTDYWLGPRNATADGKPYRSVNRNQVSGRYSFPPYENGIRITGTAGYSAAVPDSIRELTMWVAMQFAQPVLEMSIPGVQTYQLGIDLKITMAPGDLPLAMQKTLEDYRDGFLSQ